MKRRLRAAAVAACLLLLYPEAASPRAFTIDDLVREESFGTVAFAPGGRWLVAERRDAFETGPAFDYYFETSTALTRLLVVDLKNPGPGQPLLPPQSARGSVIAGFSPGGSRLAVFRLADHRRALGIVNLATRTVRWFDLTPDQARSGRSFQWLSDDVLLLIDCPDHVLPWRLHEGSVAAQRMPRLWSAAAQGEVAVTLLGSGAYAAARPRPAPRRLLRLDLTTGRQETLATGEFIDLEVSPDRKRVALFEAGPDIQSRPGGPVQGAAGTATQATRLSFLDLTTGSRRAVCPACDFLDSLLSWSPSGGALLGLVRSDDGLWTDGQLSRIDAVSGRVEPIAQGLSPILDLRPELVRAGWMGEFPVVLARRMGDPTGRADWYRLAPSGPISLTGSMSSAPPRVQALDSRGLVGAVDGQVWRTGASGIAKRLPIPAVAPALPASRAFGARLTSGVFPGASWVTVDHGKIRKVARLGTSGLSPGFIVASEGQLLAANADAHAAAVLETDPHGVASLMLIQKGRPRTVVSQVNTTLADVEPLRVMPVHHSGRSGERLTSWLFLPPVAPVRPPPLIIRVYPGDNYRTPPRIRTVEQGGFMLDIRSLVGHGYAVLTPSLPRGVEPEGPMPGLADRVLAVEAAARSDPALVGAYDPDRLALLGYSFGGMSTLAIVSQTDRFRAAVALAGVSNLASMWGKTQTAYRVAPEEGPMSNWSSGNAESGQLRLGAPPWAKPDLYLRNSPLFSADRIHTPLLLATGDRDFPEQSEEMFTGLYRQGKDALLLTYWGEGHAFMSPGNVRDLYARMFAFLDRWLAPASLNGAAPGSNPAPGPASSAPRIRPPPPTE